MSGIPSAFDHLIHQALSQELRLSCSQYEGDGVIPVENR